MPKFLAQEQVQHKEDEMDLKVFKEAFRKVRLGFEALRQRQKDDRVSIKKQVNFEEVLGQLVVFRNTNRAAEGLTQVFQLGGLNAQERQNLLLGVEQIEDIIDYLSIALFDKNFAAEEQRELDYEEHINAATFNQLLSEFLVFSLQFGDKQTQQLSNFLMGFLHEIAKSGGIKGGEYLKAMLAGIRVQSGIINALIEGGMYVMTPNPDEREEIEEWDVRCSVDFIAIDQSGTVYFLNAKGDIKLSVPLVEVAAKAEAKRQGQNRIFLSLNETLKTHFPQIPEKYRASVEKALNSKTFSYCEVTVPTHIDLLSQDGEIVHKDHRDDIIKGLKANT